MPKTRSRRVRRRRGPGLHVLVDKGTKRLKSGRTSVRWQWSTGLLLDLRAPPLVEVGGDALLAHHEESIEAGQRPTQGPLPRLSPRTREINKRRGRTQRLGNRVLQRTGQTVSKSRRLKMRGGAFRAAQTVKPRIENETHGIVINRLGKRGVPVYGVRGKAHKAVTEAWTKYLREHAVNVE